MKKIRFIGALTILTAFFVSLMGPLFARLEEVPDYEFRSFSLAAVTGFCAEVKQERADLEKMLKEKYASKPEKVKKSPQLMAYDEVLRGAEALLAEAKKEKIGSDLERAFTKLQRLHYGILADVGGSEQPSKLKSGVIMFKNVTFGRLILNVPNVIDPEYRLGERLAKLEAAHLFRPGGKAPVTLEEKAAMGAFDISRLQPASNHSAISNEAPGNHYAAFLKEVTKSIRMVDPSYAKFDLSYARRILFYDELKEDATSPKITTKDRFGLKWKVKWGDEVHTDVALTRVYIDLGGTYTDLKFYAGPGETIVVLEPPDKAEPEAIKTFYQLSDALLKSKFAFHADRYVLPGPVLKDKTGRILGSGIVDEAMIDRESIPQKYLGAYYVKFKECQLSLYNPAIQRLGGASLNNIGAPDSRVARSSLVFNAWIKNKDMKDDNSRVGMLFNTETGKFDRFVEFQSDIGCTMGGLKPSGELNSFEKSFIMLMPQSVNFVMRPLYVPKAWKECTWADARWMALRIARLSRDDLERSFSECGWPSFAQKVAVERLLNRRNELVKVFKLEADGIKEIPCDPDFDEKVNSKQGPDYPVKNGTIQERSSVVQELEETIHPEGLAKIITRKND